MSVPWQSESCFKTNATQYQFLQIEENSRNLEYLGHGIGGSVSSLDSVGNHKAGGDLRAEKWKQGAKKTLLNWVTNALPK